MKKESKTRPARPPLHKVFSVAPWLMISIVLSPFQAAVANEAESQAASQPKARSISTVELASNVEQFLGKQVLVRAKIGKVFNSHWFAIQDLEQKPPATVFWCWSRNRRARL